MVRLPAWFSTFWPACPGSKAWLQPELAWFLTKDNFSLDLVAVFYWYYTDGQARQLFLGGMCATRQPASRRGVPAGHTHAVGVGRAGTWLLGPRRSAAQPGCRSNQQHAVVCGCAAEPATSLWRSSLGISLEVAARIEGAPRKLGEDATHSWLSACIHNHMRSTASPAAKAVWRDFMYWVQAASKQGAC